MTAHRRQRAVARGHHRSDIRTSIGGATGVARRHSAYATLTLVNRAGCVRRSRYAICRVV